MKPFNYFQPTEIRFGRGRLRQLGKAAARFGQRALLVTVPATEGLGPVIAKANASLESAGLAVAHFDGVVPNPTTDSIAAGAALARGHQADVVVGLGGGSSMDTAKAIAVEATHEGSCWDYLFDKAAPTDKTLPVLAVTTTSGTGSHVTQVAVATNTQLRAKSYLCHPLLFPKIAIVDPELVLTAPRQVTAMTGWDAFTHAFEAYVHKNCSPYVALLAREAIGLVAANLPPLLEDLGNMELRTALAWADTLAGLCIANAGVTLPHSVGMAISGRWPHVAHGASLAVVYPAFTRYTLAAAIPQFAAVGRILNPELLAVSGEDAAAQCCVEIDLLLQRIGLWMGLESLGVPAAEFDALAEQSLTLPDYRNNPRMATREEIRIVLDECRARE
jgi:alcohol dehydrogenase class IV